MSDVNLAVLSVKTIDHVTLVVKDLEASEKFYAGLLGMKPIARPGFGFPGLWFQAGQTQVHMNTEGDEAGRAGMPPFEGSKPSRGFHFAFEVDDCEDAADKLRQLGVNIVTGPRPRPDGPMQMYIHDPDGYLFELFSYA